MEQSVDFEELVIGSLLNTNGISFRDYELNPDDFDKPWFKSAYSAMQNVYADKGVLDVFLVLEKISDPVVRKYVTDSMMMAFHPAHLPMYVTKVVQSSVERQLMMLSYEMQLENPVDINIRLESIKAKLDDLKVVQALELPDLRWDLQVALNEILSPKTFIKTCYAGLNTLIVGLKETRFYVFGARPGVGKTVVGLELAWNVSKDHDVLFFSLEMNKSDLLKRVIANELSIDLGLLESGDLTQPNRNRVSDLIRTVENRLIIADKGGQTVAQLRSYLIAVKAKRNVEVVVVDYLQLISAANPKAPKYEQISQISMDLKNLAKEFGVAVVALAQLNRRVDNKPENTPNASDLRDSGQIEQDADVIVMLSRKQSNEDVLRDDLIDAGNHPDESAFGKKSLITLDVVKNRHGAVGSFDAKFMGEYSRVQEIGFAG